MTQQREPAPLHSDTNSQNALLRIETAPAGRSFVVGQLGQSLDGRIATPTGQSQWINGECALDHLHAVRARVDAVIVGVGTVVADDPLLNVRRVALPEGRTQPARVVIDPSGRLPVDCKLLSDTAGGDVLVISAQEAPEVAPGRVRQIRLPRLDEAGAIAPARIVAALHEAGYGKLLIEGGARTVSSFLAAGAIDRLHILVAPLLIGSGPHGLALPEIDALSEAARPATDVYPLADGDVLFDCGFCRS